MCAKFRAYVVTVGKVPGVYTDWTTTAANVIGVPDSIFKGYKTLAEAHEIYITACCEGRVKTVVMHNDGAGGPMPRNAASPRPPRPPHYPHNSGDGGGTGSTRRQQSPSPRLSRSSQGLPVHVHHNSRNRSRSTSSHRSGRSRSSRMSSPPTDVTVEIAFANMSVSSDGRGQAQPGTDDLPAIHSPRSSAAGAGGNSFSSSSPPTCVTQVEPDLTTTSPSNGVMSLGASPATTARPMQSSPPRSPALPAHAHMTGSPLSASAMYHDAQSDSPAQPSVLSAHDGTSTPLEHSSPRTNLTQAPSPVQSPISQGSGSEGSHVCHSCHQPLPLYQTSSRLGSPVVGGGPRSGGDTVPASPIGSRSNSRLEGINNGSFGHNLLGLSESVHASNVAYEVGLDPRSPITRSTSLPANTISFGRPSPRVNSEGNVSSMVRR